jgi:hypothetical protein
MPMNSCSIKFWSHSYLEFTPFAGKLCAHAKFPLATLQHSYLRSTELTSLYFVYNGSTTFLLFTITLHNPLGTTLFTYLSPTRSSSLAFPPHKPIPLPKVQKHTPPSTALPFTSFDSTPLSHHPISQSIYSNGSVMK